MRRRASWAQQIVRIENKGYAAYRAGELLGANPYVRSRDPNRAQVVGLQRQRQEAWARGWLIAQREATV